MDALAVRWSVSAPPHQAFSILRCCDRPPQRLGWDNDARGESPRPARGRSNLEALSRHHRGHGHPRFGRGVDQPWVGKRNLGHFPERQTDRIAGGRRNPTRTAQPERARLQAATAVRAVHMCAIEPGSARRRDRRAAPAAIGDGTHTSRDVRSCSGDACDRVQEFSSGHGAKMAHPSRR